MSKQLKFLFWALVILVGVFLVGIFMFSRSQDEQQEEQEKTRSVEEVKEDFLTSHPRKAPEETQQKTEFLEASSSVPGENPRKEDFLNSR